MQCPELQVNMSGKHFDKVRFILEVTTPTTSDWQSESKAPISHSRRPIGIWNRFVVSDVMTNLGKYVLFA